MRSVVAAGVLVLASCSDWDTVEKEYATRAEANHNGTWVPNWVPSSARDLRDVHNIDTIDQTLTFSAPPSDIQSMVTDLRPLEPQDLEAAVQLASELGWQPRKLEAYYVCPRSSSAVLFVERKTEGIAYDGPLPMPTFDRC